MSVIGLFKRSQQMITENKTPTELCIECESIIEDEKKEYGRVSIMTMRMLREKFGDDRANRAMWRQQKKKIIESNEPSVIDEIASAISGLVKDKNQSL
jgi:hypothetical protein